MVVVRSAARRIGVATILILVALGLWAITFAWMWIPYYAYHAEGQLYALFPIALLSEAMVVVLVLVGLIFAIVDAIRGGIGQPQIVFSIVVGLLMLTVGPVLIWFGRIPL
jgi:hypothetical protein